MNWMAIQDEINQHLNSKLDRLLQDAEQHRDAGNSPRALGIGEAHLVPFVAGIIYTQVQGAFDDFWRQQNNGQTPNNEVMNEHFVPFWRAHHPQVEQKLAEIYGL